jgi:EAL domain-containing protein (putative c-di-GMP-specific phosphodiesterase class I)
MGNICIAGLYINLKPSFGIYISADAKIDIRTCVDCANLTRKMVKNNDSIQFAYFDQKLQGLATEESQTQADLESAIDRHELQIYYQPQLSFKTGEIVGMEALLRWKHPRKGFISPSYFIPIAEKSGLIYLVGRFAFEQICRDLQDWQKRNKRMHVSFNLSRMELYQTNLTGFLKETMERYGVDPEQIEIELAEATTVDDLAFISNMIQQFKDIGIKVALSDFGNGYSSINTLETLKFDVLKLSRKFLGDLTPQKKSSVKTMVDLAKSLGFPVVAECVETQEEVDFLTSVGCDIAQGFYYTKPMQKSALEAFVFGTPAHKKIMLTDVFAR